MAMPAPRATMIQGHPSQNVLYVVYGRGVQEEEVRPVVRQMSALRGIQARAVRGSMDDPRGPKVVVIELTIQQAADRPAAIALLKRLANPEMPIAIRLIQVVVLICRCNYLSTGLGALEFYPGLGPDRMDEFRRNYATCMAALPAAALFSIEPQPPYKQLTDGIEGVLAGIGARATMVEVLPRRDPRRCTHP